MNALKQSRAARLLPMLAMAALLSACAPATLNHQVARYTPDVSDAERAPWKWSGTKQVTTPGAARDIPGNPPSHVSNGQDTNGGSDENGKSNGSRNSETRRLKQGDMVFISLMGIQEPVKMQEVIDNEGNVSLLYLGNVNIENKSTPEAENHIRNLYIGKGFFLDLNVVVIVEKETFFIRGEVKEPGKYELNPGMTLLQAIATARGFTPFAKYKNIKVTRGDRNLEFNAIEIDDGDADDPIIHARDIIVVGRSITGLR